MGPDPADPAAWEADLAAAVDATRAACERLRTLLGQHHRECVCRYCELLSMVAGALRECDAAGAWARKGRGDDDPPLSAEELAWAHQQVDEIEREDADLATARARVEALEAMCRRLVDWFGDDAEPDEGFAASLNALLKDARALLKEVGR